MLLPIDTKIDKNGLLYIEGDYVYKYPNRLINLDNRSVHNSYFYKLITTSDYILKYSIMPLNKEGMINMLLNLREVQKNIKDIDFPIGYYIDNNIMYGEIIKYYKNAPSLSSLMETSDINEINKYYYHDDDSIHNLYLLLLDALNLIEELFENKIYYTDIHSGNFVIDNNQVKLIDFDYQYIYFKTKKELEYFKMILFNYESMFYILNKKFNLYNYGLDNSKNFNEIRRMIKQTENNVRKGL